MARRGNRRKLDPDEACIWVDDTGIAVVVKGQKEHRFPHGTPIEKLIYVRERLRKRAQLAAPPRSGSLAADAIGYLKTISDKPKLLNAQGYCAHWISAADSAGETPLPHKVKIVDGRERYITTTRPYDIRHSHLTHLLKESGNLAGVQEHAQHSTPRQTMRYVGAAIPESARQVSKAIRNRLPIMQKAKPAGTGRQTG